MRMHSITLVAVGFTVAACASSSPSGEDEHFGVAASHLDSITDQHALVGAPEPKTPGEPPMLGRHVARGAGGTGSAAGNMTWHSGTVMDTAAIESVFWGSNWSNSTFAADKMAGLDRFYAGLSGSAYAGSNTEYSGANGTKVTTASTYGGHVVDLSATPHRSPRTSTVLAEVCKMISSPVANGYYPVYTDIPRGGASYCAYHSYGTCNGVPIQFGFFFDLDGDSGCDPNDTSTTHSQGLAALANVSGHEYSETVTDPRNGGWYDASNQENGDKCAWSFPPTNVVLGGESWKVQGNWSNAAFTAGTGYPNTSGQRGCIPTN